MKLFIWDDPYRVDYGNVRIVAVAETLGGAKEAVALRWPEVKLGEPTETLTTPCASLYEWAE